MVQLNPFFFLVFTFLGAPWQSAPAQQIRFEPVKTGAGLSSGNVTKIFQDRQGFLWVATQEGLVKYDGYQTRVFKHEPFDPKAPSSNDIRKIVEDRKGNIWVIAGNALNRYDREADYFVRYEVDAKRGDPLGSRPLDLFCDSRGLLWIGTVDKGVYLYNQEYDNFINYVHNPADPTSLSSDRVTGIFESRDGSLWFATDGGGLNRFNLDTATFTHYLDEGVDPDFGISYGAANIPPNSDYSPIHEDQNGRFWIITLGGGLIEMNPNTGNTQSYTHDPEDPNSLSDNLVASMFADSRGWLWLATGAGGIDVFKPETKTFQKFRDTPNDPLSLSSNFRNPFSFSEDTWGHVWIGSKGGGLHVYDPKRALLRHYRHQPTVNWTLPSDEVNTLLFDQSSTLWIGLEDGGLVKYSAHKLKFPGFFANSALVNGLPVSKITSVYQDSKQRLWLGTDAAGLLQFDPASGRVLRSLSHFGDPADPKQIGSIFTLAEGPGGSIWIGSESGLLRFTPATGQLDAIGLPNRSSQSVYSLYPDGETSLWVGVDGEALLQWDLEDQSFHSLSLIEVSDDFWNARITDIVGDGEGGLWIAHSGIGLHHYQPNTGHVRTYSLSKDDICSIGHPEISSLYADSGGNLWVGTLGGGLHFLPKGSSCFQHLTQKSYGLPSNTIYAIQEDGNGQIWVSFHAGLAVFNIHASVFQSFDSGDGLVQPSNTKSAFFKTADNQFYLGGRDGLNVFNPLRLRNNPHPPPIVITRFSKMGETVTQEITHGSTLDLSYRDNILVFEFAALDFTYPERNQYAYQLVGFHSAFVNANSKREAIFTNLDPGTYYFKVKGSNSDGVWSRQPLVLTLKIRPPFWKTWWFYTLEGLLAVAFIYSMFLMQKRRLHVQQNEALLALDLKRKTEELEYARHLQLSMLPKKDLDHPQFETFGRMRTATEVGGDYFDYFKLSPTKFALTVGDATGHGFAAGLVVGMTKMSSAVWAMNQQASPQEFLEELNLGLKRSLSEKKMGMALGLVTLDLSALKAELAFSGMPFPYHFQAASGKLTTLVMKGPPLGYFERIFVQTHQVMLAPKDYLIFLSDGFLERFNPQNQLWGTQRLEACLAEICRQNASAGEVTETVFKACDAFADGRHHDDDMTMVVLRMKEPCAPA